MQKLSSTTKIAIGFVTILAAGYFGQSLYSSIRVANLKFGDVVPGKVNLVGINLGNEFRIIVANDVASLVRATDQDQDRGDHTGASDTDRKHVPISYMLGALQGDETALSRFVSSVDDLNENDLPPVRVEWAAEDLKKAIAGDPKLLPKLEQDLNVKTDGTPLPEVRITSIENGIVIVVPVPIQVAVGSQVKTLTAHVRVAYKPAVAMAMEHKYEDKVSLTRAMLEGYYIEVAKPYLDGTQKKEDVGKAISLMIGADQVQQWAENPEHILKSAKVVINDRFITGADLSETATNSGPNFNLAVHLTPEGADRLWQYSRGRVGTQLLLTVEGSAIAAPRIEHELSERDLVITKLPYKRLAQEACDAINSSKK